MRNLSKKSISVFSAVAIFIGLSIFVPLPAFAAGPTTVDLGTAAPFAILAGTGITDSPTSTIIGNIGLSPTTGAAITGISCAAITGTIYTVDLAGPACRVVDPSLLTIAKNDLTTAYNDAAGRTPVTITPTELGGTTKTPGVYSSASTTFGITAGAGPLVLDAQGDANGVFIFEMDSGATGLTVGPGSTVSLVNGAQACNVFWRLNTATIDTTAVFKGNILALTSITVNNGANIEGRLLARNGNVTLINDTITRPTCTVASSGTSGSSASSSSSAAAVVPKLPNTGMESETKNDALQNIVVPTGIIFGLLLIYLARTKWAK